MTEKEIEKIYNEGYRAVYWTAMSLLRNEADAEDVDLSFSVCDWEISWEDGDECAWGGNHDLLCIESRSRGSGLC